MKKNTSLTDQSEIDTRKKKFSINLGSDYRVENGITSLYPTILRHRRREQKKIQDAETYSGRKCIGLIMILIVYDENKHLFT